MKYTNKGLVEFLSKYNHANSAYWYGTIAGMRATKALYNQKKKQYPAHYRSNRTSRYNSDIKTAKNVMDCIGAIKGYFMRNSKGNFTYIAKYDLGANGYYKKATVKGDIKNIPEIPGLGLWKSGHAGVYLGNGLVFEASCFANGILIRPIKETPFTKWYKIPWIEYEDIKEDKKEDKKELTEEIIDQLARECIKGVYGNYPARKNNLNKLGYGNIYSKVQKRVNEILKGAK